MFVDLTPKSGENVRRDYISGWTPRGGERHEVYNTWKAYERPDEPEQEQKPSYSDVHALRVPYLRGSSPVFICSVLNTVCLHRADCGTPS